MEGEVFQDRETPVAGCHFSFVVIVIGEREKGR